MKKYLLLILTALLVVSSVVTRAQSVIGLDSTYSIVLPPFKNQLDTMSYQIRIKNYGLVAIDSIEILSGVIGSGFLSSIAVESTTPDISSILLQPGDTITTRVITQISPNRFPLGLDVVVIWPRAAGAITLDSTSQSIYILPFSTQVAAVDPTNEAKIFPNPFSSTLFIGDAKNIEKLLVFDLKGNLIFSKPALSQLDFSILPEASYVLELVYKNGPRKKIKLVKNSGIK